MQAVGRGSIEQEIYIVVNTACVPAYTPRAPGILSEPQFPTSWPKTF
jgi:hypothetical protein